MPDSPRPGEKIRVGVVGGSIAGCAASIELIRDGHDVTVYERSTGDLRGRGAGIVTTLSAIKALVERDLVDRDMPRLQVDSISHIGRSAHEPKGHVAGVIPVKMEILNWGDLFHNLRRRVPDARYRRGFEVTTARNTAANRVALGFADGTDAAYDLAIFADGYHSLGRRAIYPGADVRYRGYVLWRGILEEAHLDDTEPLEGTYCRIALPTGHCVFYFTPGGDGSLGKGNRWISWAMYVPLAEQALPQFLVDKNGVRQPGSLPPGTMRLEEEDRLKHLARESLPPYYGEIISRSERTFAQPIYTVQVPAYYRRRICLVGDAGSFSQPFTASGVFKGINNVIALASSLKTSSEVDDALAAWNKEEILTATRIYLLGQQLEEALIWSIPDFAQMNQEDIQDWWNKAAKMPEDMFPGREQE